MLHSLMIICNIIFMVADIHDSEKKQNNNNKKTPVKAPFVYLKLYFRSTATFRFKSWVWLSHEKKNNHKT